VSHSSFASHANVSPVASKARGFAKRVRRISMGEQHESSRDNKFPHSKSPASQGGSSSLPQAGVGREMECLPPAQNLCLANHSYLRALAADSEIVVVNEKERTVGQERHALRPALGGCADTGSSVSGPEGFAHRYRIALTNSARTRSSKKNVYQQALRNGATGLSGCCCRTFSGLFFRDHRRPKSA